MKISVARAFPAARAASAANSPIRATENLKFIGQSQAEDSGRLDLGGETQGKFGTGPVVLFGGQVLVEDVETVQDDLGGRRGRAANSFWILTSLVMLNS